jgi:hypothetical protein
MRWTSSIPGYLVVGAVTLMLLSVACEPPLPTPGTQALPTDTPTPTLIPLSATPTLPTPEIQARPIHTPAYARAKHDVPFCDRNPHAVIDRRPFVPYTSDTGGKCGSQSHHSDAV